MIATATPSDHQQKFVELLPLIRSQAHVAFRCEPFERRRELVAEVVANCWVAFVRLVERGLESIVYATPLTQFAIKQVRSGRRVGTKLNVRDVTSEYCQRAVSDIGGEPDDYRCVDLPGACNSGVDCGCVANEPCGFECEDGGAGELTLTCPGG